MKLNIRYALLSLGLGLTVSSQAIVTFGGSDAYGVQSAVTLLTFNLNVAAVPTASGTAPRPIMTPIRCYPCSSPASRWALCRQAS